MSVISPTGRQTTSDRVSVVSTTTQWVAGAWVEAIASMPGAAALSHLTVASSATGTINGVIQVGIGSLGAETVIATIPFVLETNVGVGEPFGWIVLRRLSSGTRVAVRAATDGTTAVTFGVVVGYWSDLDEDDDNTDSLETLEVAPTGDWTAITTATPAWSNSAWEELHAGLAAGAGLVGVAVVPPAASDDYEVDLGIGAAGAEVVIGTMRVGAASYSLNSGLHQLLLPAPYVLASTARIAARTRVSTTSGLAAVALLYYGEMPTVEVEEEFEPGQNFGPLIWAECEEPDGTTYVAAPVDLPDPATYYHGYKAPTLLAAGRMRRGLSDDEGEYQAQRFEVTLSDMDRRWRTWLGMRDVETLLLNRRIVCRMISDEARRLLLRPRTVAIGQVRGYTLE